jgi:SAM-dependent methyltransferase
VCKQGSDFLFCKRAKEAGFKVWASYDHLCGHIKDRNIAEIYQTMKVRDVTQMTHVENVNTPQFWDAQWKVRTETENGRQYPFQDAIVELCQGKRVVDFGCGDGVLLKKLVDAGVQARGIDFSPTAIAACQEKGLDVLLADHPEGEADVYIATELLEHIQDEVGLLNRMHELAPCVIYTVPNNQLPPVVCPEHLRVYTRQHAYDIAPYFKKMIDFGNYLLVISESDDANQVSSRVDQTGSRREEIRQL